MKILVTGANGFVAQEIISQLITHTSFEIIATSKGECRIEETIGNRIKYFNADITDGVAVDNLVMEQQPHYIIHCAAISHAEICETNQPLCWNTNVTATRFLLDAAKKTGAGFCLLSTNFVFDGEAGPYTETDMPNPIMYYGSSKVAAEKAVLASGIANACVARTVLVYGKKHFAGRHNLLTWAYQNLLEGKTIKVVGDQMRTPTYVKDLAKGVMMLMQKNATGIFHLSGTELMTPYEMVIKMAGKLKLNKSLVEKVDVHSFKENPRRPLKGGFICTKAEKEIGYKPTSFKICLEEIFG